MTLLGVDDTLKGDYFMSLSILISFFFFMIDFVLSADGFVTQFSPSFAFRRSDVDKTSWGERRLIVICGTERNPFPVA